MTAVPVGWRRTRLNDVCHVSPRDPALPSEAPFVTMAAVDVGRRFPTAYETRGVRGGVRARANDVLFARITPCLENGKLAQLPSDALPTGGSTEFIVVRPGPDVDPAFIYYWCLEPTVRADAQSTMSGVTGRMRLSGKDLARFTVDLPPLGEQRRIVEILEDHLSRLDAAQREVEHAGRRLASFEASGLSHAVVGEEVQLDSVTDIQGGIQKQPKRTPKLNSFPFLRVANVTAHGLDLAEVHRVELFNGELDRLRLAKGDLLVVEGNGSPSQIGRAAMWDGSIPDCVHQNHLIRVRARHGLIPEYLELAWNAPSNRRRLTALSSSSSGLHTLSVSKLKLLEINIPTSEEQVEIAARVRALREQRHSLASALQETFRHAAALRRSLFSAAFSGRLTGRASDLDRAEEAIA